ncbi:MAG: outer membrane beta-barrel protein [Nevskiaceae bacterium]
MALISVTAAAQEGFDSSRASADVGLSGVYTDNFYYGTDAEVRTSAMGAVLTPQAEYKAAKGKFNLLGSLAGEVGTFDTPGSADDYEDVNVNGAISWLATRRGRLDVRAGFERRHDPFGINRTENALVRDADLDIWQATQAGMLFHYGSPEAVLNAEVGLSTMAKAYQTNEAQTRFLGYRATAAQYALFYNIGPKTSVLFDFVRSNVSFEHEFTPVDTRAGNEYRVRTGLRWLASAKTSGDVRVGVYRRDFDQSTENEEGLDWEIGANWAPRARTLLELKSSRASQESYRTDTQVNLTRDVTAGWTQYWGARTSSKLRVSRGESEFVGLGRTDSLYNVGLGVDRTLSQSLTVVMSVDSFSRTSNDSTSEFERFIAYVGVRLGG